MLAPRTSLLVAVLTIFVATPIGTLAAYGLTNSTSRLRAVLFPIMISPMMVPIILVAIGLFYFYVQFRMVNSILGLVLGHSLVAMPLVLIIVMSALKNYDMNQEKVARSLGASRPRAFLEITLPQIKFSLVSAALISFLTSFDEIIISLFVSGGDNSTITRSMFLALRDQIDPTIAAAIVGSIWSRNARNMLRVMVELSPPDTKSEMMISSNDVRNEISAAETSENLICGRVISRKARGRLAPSERATFS